MCCLSAMYLYYKVMVAQPSVSFDYSSKKFRSSLNEDDSIAGKTELWLVSTTIYGRTYREGVKDELT